MCFFNQHLISSRQWVGPDGLRALLPKTDGLSLMMSAFQSRETGFGMNLSRIHFDEINESRCGKKCGRSNGNPWTGNEERLEELTFYNLLRAWSKQ